MASGVKLGKEERAHIRDWVRALRSRKYTQGEGRLRSVDGARFCCLGVACDLYKKKTGMGRWEATDNAFVLGLARESGQLPSEVARWYGLDENPWLDITAAEARRFEQSDDKVEATSVNDDWAGYGFGRIATMIERTYLGRRKAAKKAKKGAR